MKKEKIMEKISGYGFPDAKQFEATNYIVVGKDVFFVAPTKARFVPIYAALFKDYMTTLVIEPTISAAHIQVARLKDCGVAAECLDSAQTKNESAKVLEKLSKGQLNFLYVTPQRLFNKEFFGCC